MENKQIKKLHIAFYISITEQCAVCNIFGNYISVIAYFLRLLYICLLYTSSVRCKTMCYANKIQQAHKELKNNPLKMEMFQKGWFLREELQILHLKLENQ